MTDMHFRYDEWVPVKVIGSGSFSTVYEIERTILGKKETAALKVISIPKNQSEVDELRMNGYNDRSITAHFENSLKSIVQEYMYMAEMKGHPNIVYCDDIKYVQKDSGFGWDIYIRMELLNPFTKILNTGYSESETIKLGMDISRALVACHAKNIIHRDIKPQNIFISKLGDYKLGDFGVAKTLEHTQGGTIIGTVNYMAPEVYNNQPYDKSADIYSLGMVLYWLMNERRFPFLPLPPNVPTYSDMEESARRRFRGVQFPEPAHGSEELKRIVYKACAFNPKDRYATAEEMLHDLERISSSQTAKAESIDHKKQKAIEFTDETTKLAGETTVLSNEKPEPNRFRLPGLLILLAALIIAAVIHFFPRTSGSADTPDESLQPAESMEPNNVVPEQKSINIAFVMDFSGSMLFPADLYEAVSEPITITSDSLDEHLSKEGTYFVITNPETTATVYRIEYDNGWAYSDASIWLGEEKPEQTMISDEPAEQFKNGDGLYMVYTAGQEYLEGMKTDPYALVMSSSNRLAYLKEYVISFVRKVKDDLPEEYTVNIAYNAFSKDILAGSDFICFTDQEKEEHYKDFYEKIRLLKTDFGTRQLQGLLDAEKLSWNDSGNPKQKNYVILITDGYLNDEEEVLKTAESMKKNGIELIVIGMNLPLPQQFINSCRSIASENMLYTCDTAESLNSALNNEVFTYITAQNSSEN
ncbi:MAG: protein kinase [Erysipelotrichaceae bacterium]|nr:protein kinase [Erysipelotrichaceae bacterium]